MSLLQIIPGEILNVAIDFGSLLGSGETLSTAAAIVVNPTGELTIGTATISGDQVVFIVTTTGASVVAGRRYLLTSQVTTSASETLKEYATIAILG